jgi:hypothetical protein
MGRRASPWGLEPMPRMLVCQCQKYRMYYVTMGFGYTRYRSPMMSHPVRAKAPSAFARRYA